MTDVLVRPPNATTAPPVAAIRPSRAVLVLGAVVVALATFAAAAGLLWPGGDGPSTFTSIRGEQVDVFGEGVYRYDSDFKAGANRGSDLVTLVVAAPALAVALLRYRRRSVGAALAVVGLLTWFVYVYASMAVGTAYNELFVVYVGILSAAVYGIAATVTAVPGDVVRRRLAGLRVAGMRRLLFASGAITAVVWFVPLVAAAIGGEPPKLLGHSTTMVTEALDVALITPATFVTAWLLGRRHVAGYLLTAGLLTLLVALLPMIGAQTVFQLAAGIDFGPGEIIGPIAGFMIPAAVAAPLLLRMLRTASAPSERSVP